MNLINMKTMKTLFVALTTLASVASLWAQGQMSTIEADRQDWNSSVFLQDGSLNAIPPNGIFVAANPSPPPSPTISTGSSDVEIYALTGGYDWSTMAPGGATITLESSPTLSAPSSNQGLSIQPVPEPSTFALSGLALGLMLILRMRNKIKMANKPSEIRWFQ
jgi:hypothetical protein